MKKHGTGRTGLYDAPLTEAEANAQYVSPMTTDAQMHDAWLAMLREKKRSEWAKKRNLPKEDVGIIVNTQTHKAYFQWRHVIPAFLKKL